MTFGGSSPPGYRRSPSWQRRHGTTWNWQPGTGRCSQRQLSWRSCWTGWQDQKQMMVERLETAVERLWAEIETRRDELVSIVADLVRRPSLLGEEGPAQTYVADYLRASGMTP